MSCIRVNYQEIVPMRLIDSIHLHDICVKQMYAKCSSHLGCWLCGM